MKTNYNKLKTTTLMTIAVFALIGTTGIGTQSAFAGVSLECTPPPSNMVAWWPGDGNADDVLGDNDGIEQNGATYDSGKVDQGFSLDGVDDFVNATDADSLDITDEITIDAWINTTAIDTYYTIVAKGNATDDTDTINYGLQIIDTGILRFFVFDGTNYDWGDSTDTISTDKLTHVAVTFNATSDSVEFYIDGISAGSDSISQDMMPNDEALDIGRHNHKTLGDSQYFPGIIDELEIFDRVLHASEIQAIANADYAGKCKTGVYPDTVTGIVHPGEIIVQDKKLLVLDLPGEQPHDILVNVTKTLSPDELCKDLLNEDVLTLTNTTSPTTDLTETPFMINYTERVTGMPGFYECTVEFIANNTVSGDMTSLANQTVTLEVIGSKGYWKNHPAATDKHLPITIGNYQVLNNENATTLFKEHKGPFGFDKAAAQLLAAALNQWALMFGGDSSCIDDTIEFTNSTLEGYAGPPDKEKLNKNNPILSGLKANHTALNNFNNYGCPDLGP
jgi:hypothetical protein